MATPRTVVKRAAFALAAAYLIASSIRVAGLARQKSVASERWRDAVEASRQVSGIVPNFIYLGKQLKAPPNALLTDVARARLDVENGLKRASPDAPWELGLLASERALIELGEKLRAALPATPHQKALDQQWKLRTEAFDRARERFLAEREKVRQGKRTALGAPMLLWDRD